MSNRLANKDERNIQTAMLMEKAELARWAAAASIENKKQKEELQQKNSRRISSNQN